MCKARILVVEDEVIIAMEIKNNLRSLGYEVTSIVDSSSKAIQKAEQDKPDLILMDIRIKGDLDGIETAEIIRNRFGIPVVFSTAYLDEERIERAKITMPFGYLLKPIQERDLKVTLEMALYVAKVDAQRRQAENKVRESEHRLAAHLKNTPMGVIEFDNQFKIISWNKSAERIFGYSENEALGENTFDLIVPEYEKERVLKVHRWENPSVSEHLNDNKTKDGRIITCKWFNTPIINRNGELSGLTCVCEDITEKRRDEQLLQHKILSLTKPEPSMQNVGFEDLFDLKEIQQLQDQFASATGVASVITQTNGEPITKPSNFCRLCNDIIRESEKGRTNCYESDAVLGQYNPDGPTIQRCKSGGLLDAGAAVIVDGRHIANWLIGQVRDETVTEAKIKDYAAEIGVDVRETLTAFKEVPAMSLEQFKAVANMLFTLANQLSTLAYQNLSQARLINKLQQKEADGLDISRKQL